ncbi:DNA primase [Patescibacteria group bacterium]|nr:DNA primase [Patescibacteria group bacterium]
MAKISPVSIKYMIHASFLVEGALEKPDIIGAIFGQTEGLLGADLEMRELQKEGKIGRIEVDLERKDKITAGKIYIPTALDQSETTLIAAAVETIEKIGPCDAQVEVEKIEDVRGSKREYIVERAKKLMAEIGKGSDSREILRTIQDSRRIAGVKEYGEEKLPYGDLTESELIVVEGRADVLNLLRAGIKNVIAMNGTKLPNGIKDLGEEKEITLFVDGDRGGKLIAQNVLENARIKYVCVAPDGKEVEELVAKEILQALRKKVPAEEFLSKNLKRSFRESYEKKETASARTSSSGSQKDSNIQEKTFSKVERDKIKEIAEKNKGKGKAILLDDNLREIKEVSSRALGIVLKKIKESPLVIILDGTATPATLESAEELGVKIFVARNFTTTNTKTELLAV